MSEKFKTIKHVMTRPEYFAARRMCPENPTGSINHILVPLGFDMKKPIKEVRCPPDVIKDIHEDIFVKFEQQIPLDDAKALEAEKKDIENHRKRNALEVSILKNCRLLEVKDLERFLKMLLEGIKKKEKEDSKPE